MLTLEQLNKLRGITTTGKVADRETTEKVTDRNDNITSSPEAFTEHNNTDNISQKIPQPIEIPCNNYTDEQGHFAYIDSNTNKTIHINFNSGKVYSEDEVNRLSLEQILRSLPPEYHSLTWQEVVTNNTLYDRFGRPAFTLDEINNAIKKEQSVSASIDENTSDKAVENSTATGNEAKTDPFGFPL